MLGASVDMRVQTRKSILPLARFQCGKKRLYLQIYPFDPACLTAMARQTMFLRDASLMQQQPQSSGV
ncbi:hypothetical protein A7D16_10200 [Xanthomonas nasturtii]|nr:hypothetical protein A7D16_10200 [Xanthomonas nasturtii]